MCLISAEGSADLRHVSPKATDFNPRGSGLDEDAEAFVSRLTVGKAPAAEAGRGALPTPPPPPGAERLLPRLPEPPGTTVHPIPEGKTVQTWGTKVYFRDADGKLTPAPDGDYRLPNGRIMRVRGGENRGNS